jgi:hypothetical protein
MTDLVDYILSPLSQYEQVVLVRRTEGETLEKIASSLGYTRERIRQFEAEAKKKVRSRVERLPSQILDQIAEDQIYTVNQIAHMFSISSGNSRLSAILECIGLVVLDFDSYSLCAKSQEIFDNLTNSLAAAAPLKLDALKVFLEKYVAYESVGTKMTIACDKVAIWPELGLVRNKSRIRDWLFLTLQNAGTQISVATLASKLEMSGRALTAQIARDERFVKNSIEGLVGLATWVSPNSNVKSAIEACERALSDGQPRKPADLIRQAQNFYPVSAQRFRQVLEHPQFGVYPDGTIGLVAHGAPTREFPEPPCTPLVREKNGTALIEITVNSEILRGSGIGVPLRLAWFVGLRRPGDPVVFQTGCAEMPTLSVRRTPGSSHLSSLKPFLTANGLFEGAKIQIAFAATSRRCEIRIAPSH